MDVPLTAGVQILLSLTFLLLALWIHHRAPRVFVVSAVVLLSALLSLLLYALYFVSDYFTAEGINEAVIYHVRVGLTGAGFSDYVGVVVSAAVALTFTFAALAYAVSRKYSHSLVTPATPGIRRHSNAAALLCAVFSLSVNPATAAVYELLSATSLSTKSVTDYHSDPALNAEFNRYYDNPRLKRLKKRHPNFVFIYAESLERTYFDEKTFPGLTPRLQALETQATSFTNVIQVPGTGWTIAGMVASQCGIPLITPSHGNSMAGLNKFLPAATCLGDLLKSEGYFLTYYGGAATKFAGKGKFYETHQFNEIAGGKELLAGLKDSTYANAWGLYDDSLFDVAYEKYLNLAYAGEPFGLFLLTVDTHHPDGHISRKCEKMRYQDGRNPILNAVFCADYLLAEFIDRIRHSPHGKDTVIVLASDHLAMRNSAHELLEQNPRRNLFMILDPDNDRGRKVHTQGSALDISPTFAPFLGYELQLGLGSDLLNMDPKAEARSSFIQRRLPAWGEPISRFWGFPKIRESIEVDVDEHVVRIDGDPIAIPAFLEIDGQMQTIIKFPHPPLSMDFVRQNARDKAFLFLARCTLRNPSLPEGKTCLFAGQRGQIHTQLVLHNKMRFSVDDIRHMTGTQTGYVGGIANSM